MDYQSIVVAYVVLLVSLVFHEAAHAWLAKLGGDRTAYIGGQVTLNPLPHIRREPFGTVILPLIVLFVSEGSWILGYAHTPIDARWAHRYPKRAALMSLAGPLTNFALAGLAILGLKALVWSGAAFPYPISGALGSMSLVDPRGDDIVYAAGRILTAFAFLNLLLGIFNLIPWPPLDGAGVVEGLAPRQTASFYTFVRSQPFLIILGMLAIWQFLPDLFFPAWLEMTSWV